MVRRYYKTFYIPFVYLLFYYCFLNAQDSISSYIDPVYPQKQFSFKTLSINNGLSQNSVISIAQDSIGYLWMATQDGLNKYNGRDFKHYNKQFEDITRATFSRLGKIYIDKQNRLWIITHSGKLELYQPKTDDFKPIKLPFEASIVFQDKDLNLFIGSYDKGLYKIDAKTKDTIQVFKNEEVHKTVYNILEHENSLYVATSGSVYKLNKDNTYNNIKVTTTRSTNFSVLKTNEKNDIWLGSFGSGLFFKSKDSDSFTQYTSPELPNNLNIEDLLIDSRNRLWIVTYGNGVYLIDFKTNTIKNFKANKNNPFAIHYNDMLCLYEDATGIIWFGSDGTGASYYDTHLIKFNILTNNQVPKTVNVNMVRSITTDSLDNIWIGTSGKGLTVVNLKTDTYKTYTTANTPLASNRIISLNFIDKNFWIGHQGYGLNIIESNGNYKYYPEISDFTIWRIIKTTNNQAWLCTERHGVLLFDKNRGILKQYNTKNSKLQSNNIRALTIDDKKNIWIGTDDKGLYKLNTKTDEINKIPIVSNKIKSLYSNSSILWVGTFGDGLKKYNILKNTVTTYTEKEGLPNDVIYGILPDKHQNLWLSTNNGLSQLKTINGKVQFENFSSYDGLQAKEFNTGAYYLDKKGTLMFGGLEGINWFHPGQLTFNTVKPKTIISKLEIFSKPRDLTESLKLKHNDNTITFTFSSLHFSQPERNAFKYKLVNHDKNWIASGNTNIAHYTNLPPNTYTFQVISSNYDGIWNYEPATYSFTINKPWYLSNLAIIAYVVLGVLIAFAVYKYLKWRWLIKMQLQFEHKETARLKQLNGFKTKLYTNISHEFRTPLTLITGPIEKQLGNPKLSKSDKTELELVQRNSKRLLNLVNQLLDLSKLETGNLTLSVSQGNLGVFLKQLVKAFQFKAKEKNINFSYNIMPIENAWYDKDVIEKIVTNLLANAIKYTPKEGTINFDVSIQKGQIIITVINNGNTIKTEDIAKLFQRYYQNSKSSDGIGIGLSLVKELIVLSHGNIVANALNKDDIQFTITLPVERSFFNSSEIVDDSLPSKNETLPTSHLNNVTKPSNKPLMLIVEDDEDIRIFLKSIFNDLYTIEDAIHGESGIKKAIKFVPDIIISDIMMPKTNGIELCNTLKQDERTSHIPIILLTAKSGNDNEIEGLKTGADDYVVKPFNTETLKIKVKNLITLRQQLQQRYTKSLELKDIATTTIEEKFLIKLKNVLNENITDPAFTSAVFSDKMLMSRMQLHRKLKALTGQSTTELIRTERLKLGKELLLNSDLSISEIGYQIGFNTPSYFIKCFKDTYNCTPSEYVSSQQ
ncbi:hybrid sensor histidine kinase/response regulator transcription factor [Algibacter pectinivorans]|uniref:histidine kinase n=1 Tax=Algibacter pectinivorans TaxID=870482 RepID=A0A1I1RVS5_9FLAO|nr:hybrid sensor histidine kinase/response regulator transcription factor [Algibacter pectinivorans]SFD38351.1 Signal transduction histidine kinase [Algibacter pectinivorans]